MPQFDRADGSQPRLRRRLAPNPSPLTYQGTNTYILGSGQVAVIDPGPDNPIHLAAILAALEPGEEISHILVTHPHRDHSALAPALAAATGAPILGYGTATDGRSPIMQVLAASDMAARGAAGGDGLDHGFRPDIRLAHAETVQGADWQITALHTPGHLGSHLCFAIGPWLFSGDHVMGWSSSVISPPDGDMRAYIEALEQLDHPGWTQFLPGHGADITNPQDRIRALITHRRTREAQILAALADGPADPDTLSRRLYNDIPVQLLPAARQNILAHLIDLQEKNRVIGNPTLSHNSHFKLI